MFTVNMWIVQNASAAFRVCEWRAVGAEQHDFSLEVGAVQIVLPPMSSTFTTLLNTLVCSLTGIKMLTEWVFSHREQKVSGEWPREEFEQFLNALSCHCSSLICRATWAVLRESVKSHTKIEKATSRTMTTPN